MSIKVSVIIPVYNAEKYLNHCINSLLNQTLDECEFIFINDGSTDKSDQIIGEFAKKDNRILLINQDNQGVSNARNRGLEFAKGEYVAFVDADDFIEKDIYETLYKAAEPNDIDVIISNFESEIEGHKVMTRYPFPVDIVLQNDYKEELMLYFMRSDNLNTACNKIFKNSVIKNYKLKFPQKVPLGEDGMFNIRFFGFANTIKYINYSGYHYREVKGSATRNIRKHDYFQRALELYNSVLPDIYIKKFDQEKILKYRAIKLIESVLAYVHIYFTPTKELSFRKRYKYIKNMIKNKFVKEALNIYYKETYNSLGKYDKLLINMLKVQSILGLYYATAYSRFRNR